MQVDYLGVLEVILFIYLVFFLIEMCKNSLMVSSSPNYRKQN